MLGCKTVTGHDLYNILTVAASVGPSKCQVAGGSCGTNPGSLVWQPERVSIVKCFCLAAGIPSQGTITAAVIVGLEALRGNEKLARAIELKEPSAVETMATTFKALINTILSIAAIRASLTVVHL